MQFSIGKLSLLSAVKITGRYKTLRTVRTLPDCLTNQNLTSHLLKQGRYQTCWSIEHCGSSDTLSSSSCLFYKDPTFGSFFSLIWKPNVTVCFISTQLNIHHCGTTPVLQQKSRNNIIPSSVTQNGPNYQLTDIYNVILCHQSSE